MLLNNVTFILVFILILLSYYLFYLVCPTTSIIMKGGGVNNKWVRIGGWLFLSLIVCILLIIAWNKFFKDDEPIMNKKIKDVSSTLSTYKAYEDTSINQCTEKQSKDGWVYDEVSKQCKPESAEDIFGNVDNFVILGESAPVDDIITIKFKDDSDDINDLSSTKVLIPDKKPGHRVSSNLLKAFTSIKTISIIKIQSVLGIVDDAKSDIESIHGNFVDKVEKYIDYANKAIDIIDDVLDTFSGNIPTWVSAGLKFVKIALDVGGEISGEVLTEISNKFFCSIKNCLQELKTTIEKLSLDTECILCFNLLEDLLNDNDVANVIDGNNVPTGITNIMISIKGDIKQIISSCEKFHNYKSNPALDTNAFYIGGPNTFNSMDNYVEELKDNNKTFDDKKHFLQKVMTKESLQPKNADTWKSVLISISELVVYTFPPVMDLLKSVLSIQNTIEKNIDMIKQQEDDISKKIINIYEKHCKKCIDSVKTQSTNIEDKIKKLGDKKKIEEIGIEFKDLGTCFYEKLKSGGASNSKECTGIISNTCN